MLDVVAAADNLCHQDGVGKPAQEALSYQSAVLALNSLQSNAETVRRARAETAANPAVKLTDTLVYLRALGIEAGDLSRLNAVHVSGTKGKGSVCAHVEALLRARRMRTGFFSSPHLLHVRERIRIDGRPIGERQFAAHFWTVYNALAGALPLRRDDGRPLAHMPSYFKFLTVMAFWVFLHERVDVAVVEVGIGGEYDCTNVFPLPAVCGVASLDLDHCELLGDTLPAIAWHKAGIFKRGSVAVAVRPEVDEVFSVLTNRAAERHCRLLVAPPISAYDGIPRQLIANWQPANQMNVSLALQLADRWCRRVKGKSIVEMGTGATPHTSDNNDTNSTDQPRTPVTVSDPPGSISPSSAEIATGFTPDDDLVRALANCEWPGRTQVVQWRPNVTVFLDGAHTPKSLQLCSDWFCERSFALAPSARRVLVFHCTGYRDADGLLTHLPLSLFHSACFCPQIATPAAGFDPASDQSSRAVTDSAHSLMQRCRLNAAAFQRLRAQRRKGGCECEKENDECDCPPPPVSVHPSAGDCLAFLSATADECDDDRPLHVLVTGSLHLIGAFMHVLGENLD